MRCMELNKQRFFYALYIGREELEDEYGNKSGEYKLLYDNPVEYFANISAARGETQSNQFGENIVYDKSIILDKGAVDLDEYSILWIDSEPELDANGALVLNEDGTVKTPHDYIVKKVAMSLHSELLAISKVTVSG